MSEKFQLTRTITTALRVQRENGVSLDVLLIARIAVWEDTRLKGEELPQIFVLLVRVEK